MSENTSAISLRDGRLCWLDAASGKARDLADAGVRDSLAAQLQRPEHSVVFAAPGESVRLLECPVQPEEWRHLDASLPFMLEETLSDDIEALHFARVKLDDSSCGVAVLRRDCMRHWEDALSAAAGQLPWIPEPLLLPRAEGEWTVVIEDDSALLRFGRCQGARVELSLLPPLLEALRDGETPARVVVYGSDETADRKLLAAAGPVNLEWRRGGLAAAMLLRDPRESVPDLRQGEFAPQLPYARWWSQWRGVAAMLAAVLLVHVAASWLDYRRLERENLALRGEIEAVYRQVNPRGAVVDAEKQLRRQLAELRGGDAGQSFSALLAPFARLVAEQDDTVLASLNYNQRSGELRVNLLAPGFAEVEGLRAALADAGLAATLESSSRSGERIRARLRVGGDS